MKKTSRAEVTQTLRNYLACEHYVKKKTQKVFSPKTLKVFYPDVPHQTSLSDCGLYVLQYVESFFEVSQILCNYILYSWTKQENMFNQFDSNFVYFFFFFYVTK